MMNYVDFYSEHLRAPRVRGDEIAANCPHHDDRRASFSANINTGLWMCHAGCGQGNAWQFAEMLGVEPPSENGRGTKQEVVVSYEYKDESGHPLYRICRTMPKGFFGQRYEGGQWVNGLKGVRRVLYRLPEVLKAQVVYVVEGEKDVDRLWSMGIPATTNPGGAGKWRDEYSELLVGKKAVVIPDNDEPGKAHALQVARSLFPFAEAVKVVSLPDLGPRKEKHGEDISDWLDGEHTKEELGQQVINTPQLTPQDLPSVVSPTPAHHFTLIGAKDLIATQEPETDWIWDGILPSGGMSLLVAKPKVGKTTLALNLAVALSKGVDLLGRKTQQAPCVYLALEEKRSEVQKKIKALGVTDEPLCFHFGSAPHEAVKEVEPLIKQTGAKLLVIDVLQKFVRVKDLNDYAQVTRALEPLMATARKENCHILLTHHAGKSDRQDGDDILGSTGLLGGVDTSVHIKKRDQRRTFFTIQRYGEDVPETVLNLKEDGSLEALGSRREVEIEEIIPLILDALGEETLLEKEIWGRVERNHSVVAGALRLAVERDQVRRTGTGKKGSAYTYEKNALFVSPVYIGESKRESETAEKPLPVKEEFSLGGNGQNTPNDETAKRAFSTPTEGESGPRKETWEEV